MSGTEDLVNIDGTKESITTTTTLKSSVYDEIWYNAHEECGSWYDVPETMDGYQEWDNPSTILEDTSPNYKSASNHIKPEFYIGDRQTLIQDGQSRLFCRLLQDTISSNTFSSSSFVLCCFVPMGLALF